MSDCEFQLRQGQPPDSKRGFLAGVTVRILWAASMAFGIAAVYAAGVFGRDLPRLMSLPLTEWTPLWQYRHQ